MNGEFKVAVNKRGLTIAIVAVLIVFAIIALIAESKDFHSLLGKADWIRVLPASAMTVLSYVGAGLAFASVADLFGIKLPLLTLTNIGFVSTAFSELASMGGLSTHAVRIAALQKLGYTGSQALAASVFNTYLNTVILAVLLTFGVASTVFTHKLPVAQIAILLSTSGIIIAALIGASLLIWVDSIRSKVVAFVQHTSQTLLNSRHSLEVLNTLENLFKDGLEVSRTHPVKMLQVIVWCLLDWAASAAAMWFCYDALGEPLHIGVLLTGYSIAMVASLLSAVPAGLGVQEGSLTGIYVLLGADLEQSVLAAVLFRLVFQVVPFIVSCFLFARMSQEKSTATTSD